jgi:hypothetical protein
LPHSDCDPHYEQVLRDQAGHLDHFDFGLLILINYMFGSAWFGVWLNSGGATHAMKLLEQEEYTRFVHEFEMVPSALTPGKLLHSQMKLQGRALQIAVAWRHYSGGRLRAQGFGELWQRRYLELPEFYGYVGSFSEFHYGVRFPLIFPEVPEIAEPQNKDPLESSRVQNDLVHLRGHMYLARRCMQDPLGRRNFVKQTPEDSPTNIFSCPSRLGMEALTQFLAPEFDV